VAAVRHFLDAIKFEHTVFALPFAYVAMVLAADGWPGWHTLIWVTLAMVGARTLAMSVNRLADRFIDAANPRTARRHLPTGLLTPAQVTIAAVGAAALLVVSASMLNPLCLALAPLATLHCVGKQGATPAPPQHEINSLLIGLGRTRACVVRLKGGDPFVFGRGAEEALACLRAGIPVTVVPGVTSAVGVPTNAWLPVTHRGVTQEFHVVSVHVPPGDVRSTVDWALLGGSTGTLVLLMSVPRIGAVAAELLRHGRSPDTPVSVIADGTMPTQRTINSSLEQVEGKVTQEGIRPPAIVALVRRTMPRTSGRRISTRASFVTSWALETCPGASSPSGRTNCVSLRWSRRACAFIILTKLVSLPCPTW